MKRRILSYGPILETLRRPNLLKSVTTFTSRAERIITLLSWASCTSGVEGPFSKSKPSTARKSRFDLENGPSTPDVLEAQLNNVMIRSAREVNVVTDFSKLGRRSVSRIGPFERI